MSIHSSRFQFIKFVLHFFSEEIINSMKHESYLLLCAMIKCTNEPVALNKQFQLIPANYVLAIPCGYIPNNLSQYFWSFSTILLATFFENALSQSHPEQV